MVVDRGQNRHALYGALIGVGLIALTLVFFFIPDVYRKLRPSIEVVAVMAEAGALERGSEVWLAGREVGTVVTVEFRPAGADSATRVAVTMDVPKKFQPFIRKDSEVRITTERVIGVPVLDILPGSPTAPPIDDHDTLRVRHSGTITELLEKTEALTASSQQFFTDVKSVEHRTTNRAAEVARLNRNLGTTMSEFRTLTTMMRSSPGRALSDPTFKQMLQNLSATSRQVSNALTTAAERARRAQSDAEPSLRRLSARADTIGSIIAAIQARIETSGGGLLIRAQKDTAIVKGLHEAQVQLDSLIAETKRNPLRFWF